MAGQKHPDHFFTVSLIPRKTLGSISDELRQKANDLRLSNAENFELWLAFLYHLAASTLLTHLRREQKCHKEKKSFLV